MIEIRLNVHEMHMEGLHVSCARISLVVVPRHTHAVFLETGITWVYMMSLNDKNTIECIAHTGPVTVC